MELKNLDKTDYFNESESDIVCETCRYIKSKKYCIPEEKLDEVVIGSYLNIVEYIEEDKQNQFMEMIGMAERVKGVLELYKEEMKEEMKEEVKEEMREEYNIEMAKKLKEVLSAEKIAKITGLNLRAVLLL